MRLIDADAFDRDLCNAKFSAALNEAYDADRSFEDQEMYYSTQSFRDVMKYRPTIDAVPIDQLFKFLAYLFHDDHWRAFLSEWILREMKIPCEIKKVLEDPKE